MIRCAVLVVSAKTEPIPEETSVHILALLRQNLPGLMVMEERQTGSDRHLIEEILRGWCDEEEMDLVVTIGGTLPAPGLSGEQITPEATAAVIERMMPSLPEAMRALAGEERVDALLDRSVAGIRARTLLLNLPGAQRLAELFVEAVADGLPLIFARLQLISDETIDPPVPMPPNRPKTGLDADEFAAFLAARKGTQ
ncbi:MAG: hypothetical protein KF753_24040 [Caldilineaceae bacterium]|nr:hypothetical protein [Caldilineaceae bacterium]